MKIAWKGVYVPEVFFWKTLNLKPNGLLTGVDENGGRHLRVVTGKRELRKACERFGKRNPATAAILQARLKLMGMPEESESAPQDLSGDAARLLCERLRRYGSPFPKRLQHITWRNDCRAGVVPVNPKDGGGASMIVYSTGPSYGLVDGRLIVSETPNPPTVLDVCFTKAQARDSLRSVFITEYSQAGLERTMMIIDSSRLPEVSEEPARRFGGCIGLFLAQIISTDH